MFTRGKEHPHATPGNFSLDQSGHPDANRIQIPPDWPLLKHLSHGVFCFEDWVWGDLGQSTRSHANIDVSLSENKTKPFGKTVKCDSKLISHEFWLMKHVQDKDAAAVQKGW